MEEHQKRIFDAVADIVAGKPVDDLDARLHAGSASLFWVMRTPEIKKLVGWSRYENSILQGADPASTYKTTNYQPYRDSAQSFLREIIDKYR